MLGLYRRLEDSIRLAGRLRVAVCRIDDLKGDRDCDDLSKL
jgi:hypothetical protein